MIERNRIANVGAQPAPGGLRKGIAISVRFSPSCIIASNRIAGRVELVIDTSTVVSPPDENDPGELRSSRSSEDWS